MSTHDPISDLITRIRNAQMRAKSKVSTPGSKMRANVLEVLKSEGYIRDYATVEHSDGRTEFDIFAESLAQPLEGRYAGCMDPNYSVTTVVVDAPVDVARLASDLGGLGDGVYRVKGFVSSPTGCVYIDLAAGRLTVQPVAAAVAGSLVFIARPQAQPAIARIAADLGNGAYSPQSA